MRFIIFLLFCLLAPMFGKAQDERFFRKLFSGEFLQEKKVDDKRYSYLIHTPEYLLDINDDNLNEALVFIKKDSEDWIEVFNPYKDRIFSYRFENKGAHSGLYRIVKKHLDNETVLIVLFYFEGDTNYINYESTSRIYFMTIDRHDLKTIAMMKGPSIFEEQKTYKGHYHLRNYDITIADVAGEKRKQVIIKHRGMSEAFIYAGNGHWKTYPN